MGREGAARPKEGTLVGIWVQVGLKKSGLVPHSTPKSVKSLVLMRGLCIGNTGKLRNMLMVKVID
jgi:hypothetical protein